MVTSLVYLYSVEVHKTEVLWFSGPEYGPRRVSDRPL